MMREDIIRTFSATFHPAQGEIPLTKIRLNVQRSAKSLELPNSVWISNYDNAFHYMKVS